MTVTTSHNEGIVSAQVRGCLLEVTTRVNDHDVYTSDDPKYPPNSTSFEEIGLTKIPLEHVINVSLETDNHPWPSRPGVSATFAPPSTSTIAVDADAESIQVVTKAHSGKTEDKFDSYRSKTIAFYLDDRQLATRLVKALEHGADLCRMKGKPEPF